jgi:AAA15 family ATPase/GTPase
MALFRLFRYITLYNISFIYYDEFDAFFHHELSENVITEMKNVGAQSVLTTHNTNLFSNRLMRPDCLFILSPDRIVPTFAATQRELRQGHNLEKLYLNGEFDE